MSLATELLGHKKLSPWTREDENDHCCFRYILGTNPESIKNRVAFIEKTPRVRVMDRFNGDEDFKNWVTGRKGSGGSDGHIPDEQLYGFDPKSRVWADMMLIMMGYELPDDENIGASNGTTWTLEHCNKHNTQLVLKECQKWDTLDHFFEGEL